MEYMRCLCDIEPGEACVIAADGGQETVHRRLRELGLVEGTQVRCIGKSPGGDPRAYALHGIVLAIRRQDGETIRVRQEGASWEF